MSRAERATRMHSGVSGGRTADPTSEKPLEPRRTVIRGAFFRWRDSIVWFDTALARGPVDFPCPCRNGPGSGASEFARSYSRGQRPRDRPVVVEHPTGYPPLASHRRASRPRLTVSFGRAVNIHRGGSIVNRELFPNPTGSALGDELPRTGDKRRGRATGDGKKACYPEPRAVCSCPFKPRCRRS